MDFAGKFRKNLAKSLHDNSSQKEQMKIIAHRTITKGIEGLKQDYKDITGEEYVVKDKAEVRS